MIRRLRKTLDAVMQRARFERDLREELRQHLDARTRDLVDGGMAPADASRQARVEFGAIERYKEMCRDERGFAAFRPLHGLTADVALAWRRLLASPQFLAFAVLSLAIGIGVTTAVYSILYALIWKPPGIGDPHQVMVVSAPNAAAMTRTFVSRPDFEDIKDALPTFSSVAASSPFYEVLITPAMAEAVEGEAVTGDYFRTVGVRAHVGRTLDARDDAAAARVIVLNHRIWRSRFAADPRVVGQAVRLGGQSFEIVGVAPRGFDGTERAPRRSGAWIPLRATAAFGAPAAAALDSRTARRATMIGRLAPDRSRVAASTELAAAALRLDAEFPVRMPGAEGRAASTRPRSWTARPVTDVAAGESRVATLIVALVALVLVVACTNLANLMTARGAARQRDIAVRRALGAGRWRLIREMLVESLVLAVLGGALSIAVIRVLLAIATVDLPTPGRMYSLEPELNLPALAVATAALVVAAIVFGLEPAVQLTRRQVLPGLSGGDHTLGVVPSRRQRAFIRWQVVTSVTFFLIAAVLARTLITEARHDPGVDVDRVAVAFVFLQRQQWDETRARAAMAAIAGQLRREPGIEQVAVSTGMPFGLTGTTWAQATPAGKPFTPSGRYEMTDMISATPEFFRTLGIAVVRGRAFDDRDDGGAPRVMVVSEKTARTFFATTDVVGRQLMTKAWGRDPVETYTIVGVARDTDSGRLMSRNNDTVYVPLAQHYEPLFVISARTAGDPAVAAGLAQKVARRVAPDLAVATAGPASVILAGPYFAARVGTVLATALGALTLVLAMVGLYGVQAHLVARRTRELGVRIALGATRGDVVRMVLGEGFRPVVEGFAIGCALAVLARVTMRVLLSGSIQPFDAAAFALVAVPLAIAAFAACYVPARRASRVDPNVALRHL